MLEQALRVFPNREIDAVPEADALGQIMKLMRHSTPLRKDDLFVHDLDTLVAQIADRGLNPVEQETYSNGVRKTTYRDADGNEIGFGGVPV